MYEFIDTTQVQSASPLPAEAVKFNGIWLDQKVPGFRTLHVSGRELLECEISDEQMGSVDGTQYQYKRYPFRTITVAYQLIAESDTAFREAYNQLNGLLDAEQAELLFNDETDKYFIATKASNSEVSPGMNRVTGDICFYCTDPRKHSTVEKTFSASLNDDGILEATIVNDGTESVPISYEITHNHENGYIGIVSEHGAMEYGQITERDEEERQKSEVLLNYANGQEIYNALTKGGAFISPYLNNGAFRVNTVDGIKYLEINQNNTGSGGYWHGAGGYKKIPADANGHVGAKNWKASSKVWFQGTAARQQGAIDFCISKGNQIIASFQIWDGQTGTNKTYVDMFVGKAKKGHFEYDADASGWSNKSDGQIYIQKSGELFTFGFGPNRYQFREPSMKDVEADQVNIFLALAPGDGYWQMTWSCVEKMSFRTDSVDYVFDIPNRYQPGDALAIDGETSKIYVNGTPSLQDEIVGTKYFLAPPGETVIQFTYSDFCKVPPTVTARIREAYL